MTLHKHNYDQFVNSTHTQSRTHTLTHTHIRTQSLMKKAHGKVTLSVEKVRPIVGRNKVQTDGS